MVDIQKPNRIEVIDALRGFALLGLFFCHMIEYFGVYWENPQPSWLHSFVFSVFNGKAYALFALLFGYSFNMLMEGQAAKGVDYRRAYSWRLVILLVLGYLHGLIYYGDILTTLAICGFLLVAVSHLSAKVLICISLFLLLLMPLWIQMFIYLLLGAQPTYYYNQFSGVDTYINGSLVDVLRENLFWGQMGKWVYLTEYGRVWKIMGLFVLGAVLGRSHFFEKSANNSRLLITLAVVWALAFLLITPIQSSLLGAIDDRTASHFTAVILDYHRATFVLFFQISVFMLLYQQFLVKKVLDLQGPCGRMSLSYYVLQSVIGVPIFYGFGFNLYPSATPEIVLSLTLSLWIVQVISAHLLLRKYSHGPLERLWRTLTKWCISRDPGFSAK